jgi:hypothetical protein
VNDTKALLDDIAHYAAVPIPGARIGTIDSGYASGRPKILFDGESTMGAKLYPYLASYTPAASQRVLLVPVGSGYVIVGRIV